MLTMKLSTSADELFKGHPEEFIEILIHGFELRFEDTPNYLLLKHLLDNALTADDLSSVVDDLEENSNHSTKEAVSKRKIVVSL